MLSGKPCLPRSLFTLVARLSHGKTHVSTGGMVNIIQTLFHTSPGLQLYLNFFFVNHALHAVKTTFKATKRPTPTRFLSF